MKHIYLFFAIFLLPGFLAAQCYTPQRLDDRLDESDLAVIGRVVSSECFYNNFGEIYTRHFLAVDQGYDRTTNPPDTVQFFTMGGRMGDEQMIAYPSLRNVQLAQGLFLFIQYRGNRATPTPGHTLYRPTAVHESYLGFNQTTGLFMDGDSLVGTIDELDQLLRGSFGKPGVTFTDAAYAPPSDETKMMAPNVSGINPRNVNAGVGDVITITGNNFGSQRGRVFFDSPDDGTGGAFTATQNDDIVSWTNTQIQTRVISEAGSGPVIVVSAGGMQSTNNQTINVNYAVTNLRSNAGGILTPRLVDDNADGNGGYEFRISNSNVNGGVSLAGNAPARAAVERAVATWQRDGDFNIRIVGETPIQTPNRDGVNIISFGSNSYDFDRELGTGTVGITFSYYSACSGTEFEVTGVDILFRRNGNPNGIGGRVNYNYGPGGGGGTDFESVALHELGHGHQLKHVADPAEVMSFRITNGATQRTISPDTRAGAAFMTNLAEAYNPPIRNCTGDFQFQRDYLSFSSASGLPVEWLSFTATPRAKVVDLRWQTGAESDNAFFAVERSSDGVNFTPLASVQPAAPDNGGAHYDEIDANPLAGASYYRIAQYDFSGERSYSQVRKVIFKLDDELSVFPNPVRTTLSVRGAGLSANEVRVYDAAGRRVSPPATARNSGVDLNVSGLPAGQYVIRDGRGRVRKFIR